jgi:hypothetical protein
VCVLAGFTAETNNLTLVGAPLQFSSPRPAIVAKLSNIPGTPAYCAHASGQGDTHLRTFGGLLYDFQASGDFLLADAEAEFRVHTRQASGAPTWPNASVNKAVAVQAGKKQVAICLAPERLIIDGRKVVLSEGNVLEFPDGGDVVRKGNTYVVRGPNGGSMRAVVNGSYIDVDVGLGRWPTKVRGLLANASSGNVNGIESRDGTVLTTPFAFDTLYGRFAESWRVPASESMLSACGARNVEHGVPKKPFFARNLDAATYKSARAVCTDAGVKDNALLDACTLDVAVIGRKSAARVFVDSPAPTAVGN